MKLDYDPTQWLKGLFELIEEYPNASFFMVASATVATALALPGWAGANTPLLLNVTVRHWCDWGLRIAVVLGLVMAMALALAVATPPRAGRWLAIALVGWRLLQFSYGVVASILASWAFLSLAGVALHAVDRIKRLLPGGRLRVPPEYSLFAFGIIIAILGLTALILSPVVRDLVRLTRDSMRVRLYSEWAQTYALDASPPEAPVRQAAHTAADVLLISDLHGTKADEKTVEGNLVDAPMRAFLKDAITHVRPKLIIAAGDMTDTGQSEAWARLASLFPDGSRVIVAPGNHDANFRSIGFLQSRRHLIADNLNLDPRKSRFNSYSERALAEHAALLPNSQSPTLNGNSLFPQLHRDGELKLVVIVLNSNRRPSSSPITNALGQVGNDQLAAAQSLLDARAPFERDWALLVVMHHHVLPAPEADYADLFLTCLDAEAILEFAFRNRVCALVHGHKHMPYVRTISREAHTVRIISVGSALYPAKGPCSYAVRGPSVMTVRVENGTVVDVRCLTAACFHEASREKHG